MVLVVFGEAQESRTNAGSSQYVAAWASALRQIPHLIMVPAHLAAQHRPLCISVLNVLNTLYEIASW